METLARAVVRFRFFIILFWMVFAGFAVSRAARVGDVLSVEGESLRPNESTEVWDLSTILRMPNRSENAPQRIDPAPRQRKFKSAAVEIDVREHFLGH